MNLLKKLKNDVQSGVQNAISVVKHPPKNSTFLKNGKITPEEFKEAGEQLVFRCPSWSWGKATNKHSVSYLPPDKQYLITKRVPCRIRASVVNNVQEVQIGSGDDEFCDISSTSLAPPLSASSSVSSSASSASSFASSSVSSSASSTESLSLDLGKTNDDDDEVNVTSTTEDSGIVPGSIVNTTVVKTRSYDASITYDNYYNSARLWLLGYAEDGVTVLSKEEIFEDISEEHARNTVTMDVHPYLNVPYVYIHPCKHASVMKSMIDRGGDGEQQESKGISVDSYFFLFLKFISTIVPTMELDYSIETRL